MNSARKDGRRRAQTLHRFGKAQITNLDITQLSKKYVSNNKRGRRNKTLSRFLFLSFFVLFLLGFDVSVDYF
jgi:hypothetical protein